VGRCGVGVGYYRPLPGFDAGDGNVGAEVAEKGDISPEAVVNDFES
jgi:hypothetical protein